MIILSVGLDDVELAAPRRPGMTAFDKMLTQSQPAPELNAVGVTAPPGRKQLLQTLQRHIPRQAVANVIDTQILSGDLRRCMITKRPPRQEKRQKNRRP